MPASDRAAAGRGAWLALFAALSAAPAARFGDVQLMEVAQLLVLAAAAAVALHARVRIRFAPVWREFARPYAFLLAACAAVSLLAMRLPFYPPPGISALKQPLVLSVARLAEMFLSMFGLLLAAAALRRSRGARRITLDVFTGVAALSAAVSILAWILLKGAGIATPFVYDLNDRVRGFFNEGGPYGMFLVAASLAVLVRERVQRYVVRLQAPAFLVLYAAALLLSGSKAGILAAASLALLGFLFGGTRRQKAAMLVAALSFCGILMLFQRQLVTYWLLYQQIGEIAAEHAGDPNYVMGRVTGALIVPRMILAHPVAGIGLGNYSLMRNDPQYLQGLPPVDEWDLTGMGLAGAMAELGIPLAVCLFVVLLAPLRAARKNQAGAAIALAAAFQPLSFLLGVNLNFFYPWLMSAFALAAQPAEPSAR